MIFPMANAMDERIIIQVVDLNYVLGLILDEVKKAGDQKTLAMYWNISEQYLSDVLRCRREPGPKILDRLGLVKMLVYRKKE